MLLLVYVRNEDGSYNTYHSSIVITVTNLTIPLPSVNRYFINWSVQDERYRSGVFVCVNLC